MAIQTKRICKLNRPKKSSGKTVLYVMSRDQRVQDNHALLYAQEQALKHNLPLVVGFVGESARDTRSGEYYDFMYAGLESVASNLLDLNIAFVSVCGTHESGLEVLIKKLQPGLVVFDFSPLGGPRKRQKEFAIRFDGEAVVVDAHNLVPVWEASQKQEYAAMTFRRAFHKKFVEYVVEPESMVMQKMRAECADPKQNVVLLNETKTKALRTAVYKNIDHGFAPGEASAKQHLVDFINRDLGEYATSRNNPVSGAQSDLSPYLHFGQISSLRVVLQIIDNVGKEPLLFRQPKMAQHGEIPSKEDGMNALFEEMLVRKELSDNFCFYSKAGYKTIDAVADWAKKSLANHADDPRDFVYNYEQWEHARTHDDAWNAAQMQLRKSGKIHGYMRMYWAKKVLEWSESPQQAVDALIKLNDLYSIDGLDPNGYVGILWSVAGLHDRPWFERPVYGSVRYMNAAGLTRKFDIKTYIETWA